MSKGRFEAYEHRIWYNAGRVRIKSKRKIQKAYDFVIDTLKKQSVYGIDEKFGMAKWIFKTRQQAFGRLKKFGITREMLEQKLETRGLMSLSKYL